MYIAYLPNGEWVGGWVYRQASVEVAKSSAEEICKIRVSRSRQQATCEPLYENNNYVFRRAPAATVVTSVNGSAAPIPAAVSAPVTPTPPPPPKKQQTFSTGSGTFVSADGLILTAEHVVHDAAHIEVQTRDGRRVRARVQSASEVLDLAILSTEIQAPAFLPVRLNRPTAGARIFTVGYPVPGVLGQEPKVSEGIVNSASGIRDDAGFMQISIPIQPGNSGGPVVTEGGDLVGVISSSAAIEAFLNRTGTIPQNVNWAVQSSLAVTLLGREGVKPPARTREQSIAVTLQASVLILADSE